MGRHPTLPASDSDLVAEIFAILNSRTKGNAYAKEDGSYAASICELPTGLRAMAATHYLDVGLALDDIGWHFLNFGEPSLVRETQSGLRVLGLLDLANWFSKAHEIVEMFLTAAKSGATSPERRVSQLA
jgi:hypothetical protein